MHSSELQARMTALKQDVAARPSHSLSLPTERKPTATLQLLAIIRSNLHQREPDSASASNFSKILGRKDRLQVADNSRIRSGELLNGTDSLPLPSSTPSIQPWT